MYARFLEEGKLLAYSYDLEQELQVRAQPSFQGVVPPPPPPLGICGEDQKPKHGQRLGRPRHLGTGRPVPVG